MTSDQTINYLVGKLENEFNKAPSDFDLKWWLTYLSPMASGDELLKVEEAFLARVQYRKARDGEILIPVSIVSDPRLHEEWYQARLDSDEFQQYYWKRLEDFLSNELTRKYGPEDAGKVVNSIDSATKTILENLADPQRLNFDYKGLVVGYVQSGKTANFTALIAKAADAGYKLIIVLSGIHSVLRRQTQIRLDKELTGMNDLHLDDSFILEPSDVKRWYRITTAILKRKKSRDGQVTTYSDLGEFDMVNVDPFDSVCTRSTPTLAIIKKNVKVLDKLLEYISQSSKANRKRISLLIIDDEADQASIDGNAGKSNAPHAPTNERIRKILNSFERKAYVGYTATPFANVLIDMDSKDSAISYDLYPRNFIVSLPKPEKYFGTSLLFQSDLSNRFIVEIPTTRNDKPYNEKDILLREGRLTENLSKAIDCFIISCAIRNLRNDRLKPMSMLVHVSHTVKDMAIVSGIVTPYIEIIGKRYLKGDILLLKQFEEAWRLLTSDATVIVEQLDIEPYEPLAFSAVWDEIKSVFSVLKVLVLNNASEDKLDYTVGGEIKVIAIGGNQLSRGLTLEGLMTSYYLRRSLQYDTLLQMGRWFGYRQRYEDLTRIFTTRLLWDYFSELATVEDELRLDIARYDNTDCTPADLAPTIRTHSRMSPTAKNKMGAAKSKQTSYSDSLHQTFRFPLDKPELITGNLNLGKAFVKKIRTQTSFVHSSTDGVILTEDSLNTDFIIANFLDKYNYVESSDTSSGIDIIGLKNYMVRRSKDGELKTWKIAIAGNQTGDDAGFEMLTVNKIKRSRLKQPPKGLYDCGVITDKQHLLVDLPLGAKNRSDGRTSDQALLILYVIDANSKAISNKNRVDLFYDLEKFYENHKRDDVLGFAIVLPKSHREPYSRIGQ